jgi:hypothetical protein
MEYRQDAERLPVKRRPYWLWAGLVLIGVGLILFGIWGFRLYKTTRSLLGHLEQGMALVEGDPMETLRENPEALGRLMHGVREDIVVVNRQVGGLARLGPAFGWVPKVGPLLAEAPDLLMLADGLTEAGVVLWDHFSPALGALQGEAEMTTVIARTLEDAGPHLPVARAAVQRALAAYKQIEVDALPGRFQDPMAQLGTLLPLLNDGLAFAEVAPQLLGIEAPRTYLVIALNESELRPTGGLITGVGEVHVQGGRVMTMTFHDSYAVDDFSQPYPDPPEALRRFLSIDLWVFRDSNWSPDFPTAVRQGLELYRPKKGRRAQSPSPVTVDGVVALDLWAVQQVIEAVEPVRVPGFDKPLRGETIMPYIYQLWAPEDGKFTGSWWRQRKSFMGPLGFAVLARIQSGKADWLKLVQTMMQLLDEKHLMVYMTDPQAEALLVERGWGGAMRTPVGDYLMVVEANLGFNKVSANIARSFTYEVDLTTPSPQAEVNLVYTNTSTADYPCEPESRYDADYKSMMERCYWSALRVYAPQGAHLLEASSHPIPAVSVASGEPWDGEVRVTDAPEGAYTVFHQALLLPTRSHAQVMMRYALPHHVVTQDEDGTFIYRLDIQKQPGLVSVPVRVVLHLPQNALLWNVDTMASAGGPVPEIDQDGTLAFDLDVNIDCQIVVRYRVEEKEGR